MGATPQVGRVVEGKTEKVAREVLDIDIFRVLFDIRSLTRDLALELVREHRISVFSMRLVLDIIENAVYLDNCPVTVEEFFAKARRLIEDAVFFAEKYAHLPGITGEAARELIERVKRLEELLKEAEGVRAQ